MCGHTNFTSAKIEAKNGDAVQVEPNDIEFTQRLMLNHSWVLKVNTYGGAKYNGHIGRDTQRYGPKQSKEYTVAAINMELKTVLAADNVIDVSAGATHTEHFDIAEVVKTLRGINVITLLNSKPNAAGKPVDICASNIQKALDAFLGGVRSASMDDIYTNFWRSLEIAANYDGSSDRSNALDVKITSLTNSGPLECLRTVNNQIKHSDKPKHGEVHSWNYCNCSNYEPPKLDKMHIYIDELRPFAAAAIRKRLNKYIKC